MAKKRYVSFILASIFVLKVSSFSSYHQDSRDSESATWMKVSNYLELFELDPMTNLHLIKQIDDLRYWTLIYDDLKKTNYLSRLFSKRFQAKDIDEEGLNVVFSLLKSYTFPSSYEIPKPIIARIIEIAMDRPAWFAKSLLSIEDWREITRLIVSADIENISGDRKGFREIMMSLKNQEVREEFLCFFHELDDQKRDEMVRFEAFLKDPAGNLSNLGHIFNLCALMGRYDDLHINEDKTLLSEGDASLILEKWIEEDINEGKIRVLFFILNHCDSAYHEEILGDIAQKVFREHYSLFISALQDEPHWRSIMLSLSYGLFEWEKHFGKALLIPGNTDLETKIRAQLEFLRENLDYHN